MYTGGNNIGIEADARSILRKRSSASGLLLAATIPMFQMTSLLASRSVVPI
jgi:hypothetical protein